jgi:ubiquinone/menaquinone biosynthesis C-methylase UbiE
MRLFGWFHHDSQQATEVSEASRPRRWAWLGGRRILTNTPYVFPKDVAEGGRLDLQHHLLKVAAGKNYRAPIRQPRAILDVACGTGIWAREMAQQFKRAQVIGFDIDRTPLEAALERLGPGGMFPKNFEFLEADALQRFPFEDESFDFTHARLIGPFVPASRWPDVVAEMVRVTRRGGYVELVDAEPANSPSQSYTILWEAVTRLLSLRGLNAGSGPYLADYLRQAGLPRVQERRFILGDGPLGNRQQQLLISDFLAALTSMQPIIVKSGMLSEVEYNSLLDSVRDELPRMGVTMPMVFAFSIKL